MKRNKRICKTLPVLIGLLIMVPGKFAFNSELAGYLCFRDHLSSFETLVYKAGPVQPLLLIFFNTERDQMSSKINLTGYSFPGSKKDVMKRSPLQSPVSPSSHLMKYDLNVQSYTDQPGAQFKKDPGGMAGFELEHPKINKLIEMKHSNT